MSYLSRTDLNIAQLPSTIPVMGPSGSIVMDSTFGNKITRITDKNSITTPAPATNFCAAGVGGSSDVNVWSTDSTMLTVEDSGGGSFIIGFNPTTIASGRVFPLWRPGGALIFSKVNPNTVFNLHGTQILKYDLTDRGSSMPPPPVVICDFANRLPGKPTWATIGGVEANDTVFTAAFSVNGPQGTGVYACAYVEGKGYRVWNTQTGAVSGDFGQTGQASVADEFTVHNVKGSKNGEWLIVAATSYFNTVRSGQPYYWQIDGTLVEPTGFVAPGGHWTGGQTDWFNNDSDPTIPLWAHCRRVYTSPKTPARIANPSPSPLLMRGLDDHLSFNGPPNSVLFSISTDVGKNKVYPAAWYNEVMGFDLGGSGKVWRFCHTFTRGNSGNFYADNAIGCVDQKNKFVCFTSDWMGTLGRPADVFVVELR